MTETCRTCRFYMGQECHRHAPLRQADSGSRPLWPIIIEASSHWCGDHAPLPKALTT